MSHELLKLTTYFGERDRGASGLVADELLDLYERRGVELSLLLRGIEGYGRRHVLRSERLLTLSEDLPIVSVAVDGRECIESLLADVLAIKRRGLVTLERARPADASAPDPAHAVKLTAYLGRHQRLAGRPAFISACDVLHRAGMAGATVLLGVDGTVGGTRRRAGFFARNAEVPLMIIAIGSAEAAIQATTQLRDALPAAPLTLERVRLLTTAGQALGPAPVVASQDPSGLPVWQKLMVHSSAAMSHDGSALHLALMRALRSAGVGGATSLRGIWGFIAPGHPEGDRLLALRRHVPVITVVVESPTRISRALEVVRGLAVTGVLATSELVPAAAAFGEGSSGGELTLAQPDRP